MRVFRSIKRPISKNMMGWDIMKTPLNSPEPSPTSSQKYPMSVVSKVNGRSKKISSSGMKKRRKRIKKKGKKVVLNNDDFKPDYMEVDSSEGYQELLEDRGYLFDRDAELFLSYELGYTRRKGVFKGKTQLHYQIISPLKEHPHSGPKNKRKIPMIILLHGQGQRGSENKHNIGWGVRNLLRTCNTLKQPVFLVVPQCPTSTFWKAIPETMKSFTLKMREKLSRGSKGSLFECDPKRVYITGLSSGGFGTWKMLHHHGELFAAAIPICGGIKKHLWRTRDAHAFLQHRIWAFHGDKDRCVKPRSQLKVFREICRICERKKMKPNIKMTLFRNVGHFSWEYVYENVEVWKWVFEQQRR